MVDREVVEEHVGLARGRMPINFLDKVLDVIIGLYDEEVVPSIIFAILPVAMIFIIGLVMIRLVIVTLG